MQMNKDEIVNELVKSADKIGVVETLYATLGKRVKLIIPFSLKAAETSIDNLDFSVRANNSMKRAGIFTIGEIIDIISNGDLMRIRNLGKKTENEIKTRIMVFGYDHLSDREKKKFFYDILVFNES